VPSRCLPCAFQVAWTSAIEDWAHDKKEHDTLHLEIFFDSVFELADLCERRALWVPRSARLTLDGGLLVAWRILRFFLMATGAFSQMDQLAAAERLH
jgi:hypothetical protein